MPGREELHRGRNAARPVPSPHAVTGEELAPAGPREREDVLDVGGGGGDGAHDRRVERPARARQEGDPGDAAQHLEPS